MTFGQVVLVVWAGFWVGWACGCDGGLYVKERKGNSVWEHPGLVIPLFLYAVTAVIGLWQM